MEGIPTPWLVVLAVFGYFIVFVAMVLGPFALSEMVNALRRRVEIRRTCGSMKDRQEKLSALIKNGTIIAIHYGAQRYFGENCHIENYFSVDGPDWTLWVAHTTDYPPEIDHAKVPVEVRAIFSGDVSDSLKLVRPVLKELRGCDPTKVVKFWKRKVGHFAPHDFFSMNPIGN